MTTDEYLTWEDVVLDCFEALHSLMFLPESDPLRAEAQELYDNVTERVNKLKRL